MDLNNLTPSEIAALKSQLLGTGDPFGRSPIKPRQLHDLRLAPTANDPRPLFIPSADTPRDWVVGPGTAYPRLLWHTVTGEEKTVHTAAEHHLLGDDWTEVQPHQAAPNPMGDMQDALASLSDEERTLLVEAQKQDRMKALQAKLAAMSPEQVEALINGTVAPAKRGRPRKTA